MSAIRFSTADSLEQYVAGNELHTTPIDTESALEETFFLGLRLNRGVDLSEVPAARQFAAIMDELLHDSLLEREGSVIRLTARGRLLSNEAFERFIQPAKQGV